MSSGVVGPLKLMMPAIPHICVYRVFAFIAFVELSRLLRCDTTGEITYSPFISSELPIAPSGSSKMRPHPRPS